MTTTLTPPKADPEVCRFFDAMIHEYDDKELCKGWLAKNAKGEDCWFGNPKLTALCVIGCRLRVVHLHPELGRYVKEAATILSAAFTDGQVAYNDLPSTTKADVIAKIKEAKALAGCTD